MDDNNHEIVYRVQDSRFVCATYVYARTLCSFRRTHIDFKILRTSRCLSVDPPKINRNLLPGINSHVLTAHPTTAGHFVTEWYCGLCDITNKKYIVWNS